MWRISATWWSMWIPWKVEDVMHEPKNAMMPRSRIVGNILALAVPAMVENILQVFIGVVDMYFIGKLGTEAIAGAGATNLMMNVYISFFIGIGVGVTAFVSRRIGEGDLAGADEALHQAMILAAFIGIFFGAVTLLFSGRILEILGAEASVMGYARPYFNHVAVPVVFLCLMMVVSSAYRGSGDTRMPMNVVIAINFINAFLDYVLIFGLGFIPALGIKGAAIATSISRLIGVVLLLAFMNKSRSPLRFRWSRLFLWKKDLFFGILRIGLPAALEKLIMRFGQLLYNAFILAIGTGAYAAHNIGGIIETFAYMPGMGFAVAASTLVGQSMGAKDKAMARTYGYYCYGLGAVFMSLVGMAYLIFGRTLAGLFTGDPDVIQMVAGVLGIIAVVQPFTAVNAILTSALQGAGDTRFPMMVTFAGIWMVRVSGAYFLGIFMGYGLWGVWIAIAIDIVFRSILIFGRFRRDKWTEIKL